MSLRTRLRIAIVTLAAAVVVALSGLYLADFTRAAFQNATDTARNIAGDVKGYVLDRFDQVLRSQTSQPDSLAAYKVAWVRIVRTDPYISAMLQRSRATAYMVVNVAIAGEDGAILAASDSSTVGSKAPTAADIDVMDGTHRFEAISQLFRLTRNYALLLPLGVPGQSKPVFTIVVEVESLFLRHSLDPALRTLGAVFVVALLVAMLLGFILPNLALRPLERVSRKIDEIRTGHFALADLSSAGESREFADVQSKLNLLGQQFRGARQDALTLRGNIDQLIKRLDDAVLLFDAQGRLVVAGQMVEHLFGRSPQEMLGASLGDLFPPSTALGALILRSIETREPLQDELVVLGTQSEEDTLRNTGGRILVSVEPLDDPGRPPGLSAMVRIRDAESRRQLQLQLDISSRLAAIGRLTGGVAHEIKNPLNAMALHLEVLKAKLDHPEPEIAVIAGEIRRLDRVVKTFLDFNRPVEVRIQEFDLALLAREVAAFLAPQAREKNAGMDTDLDTPLWIRGDPELLRQALLNVMVNGLEAVGNGGHVKVRSEKSPGECVIVIEDDGPGIPADVKRKIFNLYFTTKNNGSGIGLAMTFRVIQLHSGMIDVASEPGHGAAFRFRLPDAEAAHV